jgi:membrane protease YdiL (CAAX protease family)
VTLLGFPIPTFVGLYFLEGLMPIEIFDLDRLSYMPVILGIEIGLIYAVIALLVMQLNIFKELPTRVETLVGQMNLSVIDCIFLSLCAGVGEELLFRSGIQFYLGPWITSVLFVAVHGYLDPRNWRMSLYGFLVLPFILIISFGFEELGLWFCISAHFAYDLLLFLVMRKSID